MNIEHIDQPDRPSLGSTYRAIFRLFFTYKRRATLNHAAYIAGASLPIFAIIAKATYLFPFETGLNGAPGMFRPQYALGIMLTSLTVVMVCSFVVPAVINFRNTTSAERPGARALMRSFARGIWPNAIFAAGFICLMNFLP